MLFLLCTKNEIISKYRIQKHFKAWSDYIKVEKPPESNIHSNFEYDSNDQPLSSKSGNSYVFNCYFHDMNADYGAAILYSVINSYLLVEKCYFLKCTASYDTAAIRVTEGSCIIAFTCGYNTKAKTHDGFCSICNDSNRLTNSVFDSSVSQCEAGKFNIMYHQYGNITIKSLNVSHNYAEERSAPCCEPSKILLETKHGCDIIYCSFANNTSTSQFCVLVSNFYGPSDITFEIKNCNIVKNKAIKTIYSRGNSDIISSCILENRNPYFFIEDSTTVVTLSSCCINSMTYSGIGTITGNGPTTSFLHALTFIKTGHCVNIYDRISGVPLIGVIKRTRPFSLSAIKKRLKSYIIE